MTLKKSVQDQIEAMRRAGTLVSESQGLEALALKLAEWVGDMRPDSETINKAAAGAKELRETLKTLRRVQTKDDGFGAIEELLGSLSTPVRHTEE